MALDTRAISFCIHFLPSLLALLVHLALEEIRIKEDEDGVPGHLYVRGALARVG